MPPADLEKPFHKQSVSYLREYLLQLFKENQQIYVSIAAKAASTG